ncbi:hypothetical protein BH09PSE1_BH09PSE1_22140 [soil metagenome]
MSRADRFSSGAARYDRFRPGYPAGMLAAVARAVADAPDAGPVVDVGAGTGIFTRQLAEALPGVDVIGLEPSEAMRRRAGEAGGARYLDGAAEALPFADGSVRALTAAAAAHWFDRTRFYAEAKRVLPSGGALAILDYPRDVEGSAAAAASEAFLTRHGDGRAYERPDYARELMSLADFAKPVSQVTPVVTAMTEDAFVEMVLSSSHARAVEARLGVPETARLLHSLATRLADDEGRVLYGVRFRLFTAVRL